MRKQVFNLKGIDLVLFGKLLRYFSKYQKFYTGSYKTFQQELAERSVKEKIKIFKLVLKDKIGRLAAENLVHVCSLNGYGMGSGDWCIACNHQHYINNLGFSTKTAEILSYIEDKLYVNLYYTITANLGYKENYED